MNWAIITGASSGIGRETAKKLSENNYNILAIARREDLLISLKKEITKSNYKFLVLDLLAENAPNIIYEYIQKNKLTVSLLINNAGFGLNDKFLDLNIKKQKEMINLNTLVVTELCYIFGNYFKNNKINGTIINLASQASFLPGPYMAVYYATKAFVLSLSEALNYEFKEHNITVTAICPGPTKSEFSKIAKSDTNFAFSKSKLPTSEILANFIIKSIKKKKVIAIHPPILGFLTIFSLRFLPRKLITKISAFTAKK